MHQAYSLSSIDYVKKGVIVQHPLPLTPSSTSRRPPVEGEYLSADLISSLPLDGLRLVEGRVRVGVNYYKRALSAEKKVRQTQPF